MQAAQRHAHAGPEGVQTKDRTPSLSLAPSSFFYFPLSRSIAPKLTLYLSTFSLPLASSLALSLSKCFRLVLSVFTLVQSLRTSLPYRARSFRFGHVTQAGSCPLGRPSRPLGYQGWGVTPPFKAVRADPWGGGWVQPT